LQNFIERSVILNVGKQLRAPLEWLKRTVDSNSLGPVTLQEVEREHICKTLEITNGLVAGPHGAAARLGLKRSTFYFRMRKLGIVR
jgi:formate hydrogenlyase transcriptional activator